jgi:hypothetical protein
MEMLSELDAFVVIPSVLAVVMFIYSCIAISRMAREKYNLRLVSSLAFGLVLCAVIFATLAGYGFYTTTPGLIVASGNETLNSSLYIFSSLACLGVASYRNISRSNLWFGSLFTAVQVLVAGSMVAIAAWLVTRKLRRRIMHLQPS